MSEAQTNPQGEVEQPKLNMFDVMFGSEENTNPEQTIEEPAIDNSEEYEAEAFDEAEEEVSEEFEEVDEYVLFPSFGFDVQQLDGKEVILSGYILAIDPEIGYYVLSKGPFASCFFCGAAGPETIVELSLKSKDKSFMMDEFATFKGYLKLNSDDIYRCVYIIEFAEVYR